MAKGHAARAKRLCARPWPMVTEGRGEAVAGRWRLCTWLGRVTAMMSAPEGARGKGGGRARGTVRVERWICADGGHGWEHGTHGAAPARHSILVPCRARLGECEG